MITVVSIKSYVCTGKTNYGLPWSSRILKREKKGNNNSKKLDRISYNSAKYCNKLA